MTIRTRLTYWYAGVTLASVLLAAAAMYYEFVIEVAAVAAANQPAQPVEEEIGEVLLFYGIPSALLIVFGGWWLLRKALAPLNDLASAAERLHIHNLREPLPRTGNGDEVDRLSQVLNATNTRLENSFKQIREFTLHASHELKTPLAVLHGEIETALNDPSTTPTQREAYASQLDEIQRLTKIVEGLSLLAKADAGQVVLAQEPLQLDEIVRDSFADAQILAHPKQINVSLGDCAAVTVRGDRHRLRQLLLNLTDNAIKYNQSNGCVDIALKRNGSTAEVIIVNTGEGIPDSVLPHIFDRFFRGDESRNREVEGCGLGLSIARWIVKAHGGDIQIASVPKGQPTVIVKLPLHTS